MRRASILSCIAFALACAGRGAGAEDGSAKTPAVSVRKLADSLHAVIAADRATYIEEVLPRDGTAAARKCPPAPGHAPLLRAAAQRIQTGGAEFSYTLRSLSPINPNNGPQTQAEQDGLERVTKNPAEPYYTDEQLGGRSYFTAVYADRAVLKSCVECHNQQPKSPRHDWKQGEVMGAIVVRIPLEF